jgi:hypothetical protein
MGEEWGCHGGRLWSCLRWTINRQIASLRGGRTYILHGGGGIVLGVRCFTEYISQGVSVVLPGIKHPRLSTPTHPGPWMHNCSGYIYHNSRPLLRWSYVWTNERNKRAVGGKCEVAPRMFHGFFAFEFFLPYCLRPRLGPGKRWKWKITLQIHKYLSVCDVWITRVAYITELSTTWLIITYIPNNTPRWSIPRNRERHKGWMGWSTALDLHYVPGGHRQVKGEVRNMQKEKRMQGLSFQCPSFFLPVIELEGNNR